MNHCRLIHILLLIRSVQIAHQQRKVSQDRDLPMFHVNQWSCSLHISTETREEYCQTYLEANVLVTFELHSNLPTCADREPPSTESSIGERSRSKCL